MKRNTMAVTARLAAATGLTGLILSVATGTASASSPTFTAGGTTFTIGTAGVDAVANGPWTTSQPDTAAGQSQYPIGDLLPTFTNTLASPSTQISSVAAYPGATAGAGVGVSGQAGTPGPVDGYCSGGGAAPETGSIVREPAGINEPMSPYYFPFIQANPDGSLSGFFDYRPKDTDEALVSATSTDGGSTWTVNGEALEQNQGYCARGDTNDNGQGHSYIASVGANTYLYTLNRVAGDAPGVGLLVHTLTGGQSNPLAGLPSSEPVGVDPDSTATAAINVPGTGGSAVTIALATLGTSGTPTQLSAGTFVDYTTLTAGSPDVITCTGTAATSLTGCTAATAESVAGGDVIEQVVANVQTAVSIPATSAQNAATTGGVTVQISVPLATVATAEEANLGAGRVYVDGHPVYCVGDTVNATNIQLSDCTSPSAFSASAGDPVTLDPIQPGDTQMTSGLEAPDGIVGTVPSYPGAPSGSTVIIYGEKILNYFDPMITTASLTLPSTGTITVPVVSTSFLSSAYYTGSIYPDSSVINAFVAGTGTLTVTFGDKTSGLFASLTCTGFTSTALTGCSRTSGAAGDSVSNSSDVAIPGAATVPSTVLALSGEGSSKSATLFKNNEDFTILRAAYTTDGINFSDSGLANLGVISGSDPANDINNPAATTSPSATAPYDNPVGNSEPAELRFTGTRGSIFEVNGTEVMLLSGAWATDGDSDAFNQIFVTTSTDGEHWTTPVTVVSTDYSFSARISQDATIGSSSPAALGVSAYYAGRAYSPAAVENPTTGVVTLVFSGYSTPKPLPAVGSVLGTGSTQWTVKASDPALYRDILTVDLTPQAPAQTPEAPATVLLPATALLIFGGGLWLLRRRNQRGLSGI